MEHPVVSHPRGRARHLKDSCAMQRRRDHGPPLHLVLTAGVAIVNEASDEVLLVRQAYGRRLFCTPGGWVEAGETPYDAALREAKEEIGVLPTITGVGGVLIGTEGHCPYMGVLFTARLPDDRPFVADPEEVESIGWYSLRALPDPHCRVVDLAARLLGGLRGAILDARLDEG